MNWDAIAAIAELLGSLAVLLTLIYLAVQVRHSKQLLEENRVLAMSQVFQARSDTKHAMHLQSTNEFLATAMSKLQELGPGRSSEEIRDALSPAEFSSIRAYQSAWATHTDNVAYQTELGLMDQETKEIAATAFSQAIPLADSLGVHVTPRVRRFAEKYGRGGT